MKGNMRGRRQSSAAMAHKRAFRSLCLILTAFFEKDPLPLRDVEWERVIDLANWHSVTQSVGWASRKMTIDRGVKGYFGATLILNEHRNAATLNALPAILRALNAVNAEPLLMKGAAALVDELYPVRGARYSGDIDILVAEDRLEAASQALATLGYAPTLEPEEPGFSTEPSPSALPHHLPMQVDPKTGVCVELHRTLLRHPFDALLPTASCRSRCERGEWSGEPYAVLAATDRVILNILHTQLHHELHTRRQLDLRQLLELALIDRRDRTRIDWTEIEARFSQAGHADVLCDQACFLKELFGWTIPITPGENSPAELEAAMRLPASDIEVLRKRVSHYASLMISKPIFAANLLHPVWLAKRMRNLARIVKR